MRRMLMSDDIKSRLCLALCLHPNKAGSLGGYHPPHGSRRTHIPHPHTLTHSFSLPLYPPSSPSLQPHRAAALPEYQPVIKKFTVLVLSGFFPLKSGHGCIKKKKWLALWWHEYFSCLNLCCVIFVVAALTLYKRPSRLGVINNVRRLSSRWFCIQRRRRSSERIITPDFYIQLR